MSSRDRVSEPHETDTTQPIIIGAAQAPASRSESPAWRTPLTVAFIVTLVAGLVAEVFGSIPAAAAAMVVYFIYGLLHDSSARNTERFADSLYYMGFILTLFALFLAMTPGLGTHTATTSREVIEKFGLAIVTTFIGMSLRILLIQFRPAPSDFEEEAAQSLVEHARRVTAQTTQIVVDLERFRERIADTVRQAVDEMRAEVGRKGTELEIMVTDSAEQLQLTRRRVIEDIEAAGGELAAQLRAVSIPRDLLSTALSEMVSGLKAELAKAAHTISGSLSEFAAEIATALGEGRAAGKAAKDFQRILNQTNQNLSKAADLTAESLVVLGTSMDASTRGMVRVADMERAAAEISNELKDLLRALRESTQAVEAGMAALAAESEHAATGVAEEAQRLSQAIISSAQELRRALEEIRPRR